MIANIYRAWATNGGTLLVKGKDRREAQKVAREAMRNLGWVIVYQNFDHWQPLEAELGGGK